MSIETFLQALERALSREEFIRAANRNEWVQTYRIEKEWWSSCWTEEAISKRPPMRVEFEHAIFFGQFSEAVSMRRGKAGWGKFVGIEPLRPDDFLHPCRVVYILKPTSKMKMRWCWRDAMKHVLGRDRRLVNDAMRLSKKCFLREIPAADVQILARKLNLAADAFWQRARFGERWGPDGARKFLEQLEERTKGYMLPFGTTGD